MSIAVCFYEVLALLICSCCGEWCQKHNTLCKGFIEVLYIEDTIHAIYTKEFNVKSCLRCLLKDQRIVGIVVRKEKKLSAALLDLCKLYRIVCVAVCCVSLICNYFKSVISSCCNECVMYTGVVVSSGIIKYCYFRCKFVLGNVLSRFGSLCRVCEAHTELVCSCCDTVKCCCGWCEEECILSCLSSYCDTGTGCYSSTEHLHSFIDQVIVCVNSLLRISLVITCVKNLYFISVESTVLVDLISCDLGCVIYVGTVLCVITCHRSDHTDLKCLICCKNGCRHHHSCCHRCC